MQQIPRPGPSPARLKPRPSRNFPRSKHGCLTCRQRKKKCDEARPRCAGCVRNKLACQWSEQDSKSGEQPDTQSIQPVTAASSHSITAEHPPRWNRALGAFSMSAKTTLLTSNSSLFLHHYLAKTGPIMTSLNASENPFLVHLVPLAYSDDLVMHCLMAMGGAHLSADANQSSISYSAVEADAAVHHASALRGVREALAYIGSGGKDPERVLRTLLVVILMAEHESLSKTCLNGSMFHHLNAARELMQLVRGDSATADQDKLLALCVEAYDYLVLVNSIGPPDGLRATLTQHSLPSNVAQDQPSFSEGYHDLMNLIPEISTLWTTPSKDSGARVGISHITRVDLYANLRRRIMEWQPETQAKRAVEWHAVVEIWRNALAVYLEAARANDKPLTAEARGVIAEHISRAAALVISTDVTDSQYGSTLSWPMLIMGSCLDDPSGRALLADKVRTTRLRTWNSICALDVLRLLWQEDGAGNGLAFGPYGLFLTMRKFGLNFPVA